jgi:trigger factor
VQPKPVLADWTKLDVPMPDTEVPEELIDEALDEVRATVAELVPVEGRGAQEGDTLVLDLVSTQGETQRDYVVELGSARLLPELEEGLEGVAEGESKRIEYEAHDESTQAVDVTVKALKQRVLPPLDDELARAASEFETLAQLRGDVEARLRQQLEREAEAAFRTAAADALVEASTVEPSDELVRMRASSLLTALAQSLERRGVNLETYLTLANETPEQLQEGMLAQAWQSLARELVLEAAADELGLEVSDDDVEALVREEAEAAGEDAEETLDALRRGGRLEQLRDDLRLRRALDRITAEVNRISVGLAQAREKLWTPEQEKTPRDTNLWTPGTKESG